MQTGKAHGLNATVGSVMIGTTVSHYKILEKLGGGGMGVVYKAEDLVLGRQVALKFLPEALAEDPEALARFQREARAASALNHPHICVIHELGEEEGRYFIVMELMHGQTLKYLVRGRPMSVDEVAAVGVQLADALEAAHGARIIHRDIKPANIFVTAHGEAKVLDFGLAKVTEVQARQISSGAGAAEAETELAPEQLTTPGKAMGTVAYMSPEQVLGEELDERADLFSLGVVLYEMATGKPPFSGPTTGAVFEQILHRAPTAPVRLNPELPDELEQILNRALEKDKTLRYQHASDLKADLKRLQRDTTVSGASAGEAADEPRAPSRRGLWAAIGVAALVVVIASAFWLGRGTPTPDVGEAKQDTARAAPASIAVLPFDDMSENKDQEYFSDGLSEELLNLLARIEGLKVTARTSSFSFKGRSVDIATMAERLNVAHILEGSVSKSGNRVRIRAQLVDATDGSYTWSRTYERKLDDIFAVQDEIARSVVRALEITLLSGDADPSRARAENGEAYNLYLQGKHFAERRSEESLEKAVGYYERALTLAPGYAPASAGLAQARRLQASQAYLPFDDGFRLAKEAAARAIELDENLAEGWRELGSIRLFYDWDWAGAEAAYGRARALAPGTVGVLLAESDLSSRLGYSDQALALARRALEIDPLNARAYELLGDRLIAAGHLQEAAATYQKLLELQPGRIQAHMRLGRLELYRSRPEMALAEMEPEVEPFWRLYGLALAYHALGRREESDAALMEAKEKWGDDGAFQFGEIHAFRGEPDSAFEWLERAYARRDPGLTFVKVSALLASLHDDPRWSVFLEKMGLPV